MIMSDTLPTEIIALPPLFAWRCSQRSLRFPGGRNDLLGTLATNLFQFLEQSLHFDQFLQNGADIPQRENHIHVHFQILFPFIALGLFDSGLDAFRLVRVGAQQSNVHAELLLLLRQP